MRLLATAFLFAIVCSIHAAGQEECPEAGTQRAIENCVAGKLEKANAELDSMYKRVLTRFSSNAAAVERLKRSQKAWRQYRDAEIEARLPFSEHDSFGSSYEMCRLFALLDMVRDRTKELSYLAERQEGDVCSH